MFKSIVKIVFYTPAKLLYDELFKCIMCDACNNPINICHPQKYTKNVHIVTFKG